MSASDKFYQKMFNLWNSTPGASAAMPSDGNSPLGCYGWKDPTDPNSPNRLGVNEPCTVHFPTNVNASSNDSVVSGRVDWNLKSTDRVFLLVQYGNGKTPVHVDAVSPLFNAYCNQSTWQGQLSETHTLGPTAANQFLLGGTFVDRTCSVANSAKTVAAFPTEVSWFNAGLPIALLGGFDLHYLLPAVTRPTTYQVSDDLVKTLGRHKLTLGVHFQRTDATLGGYNRYGSGLLLPLTLSAFFCGGQSPSQDPVNLVGNAIKFTEQGEIFVCVDEPSPGSATTALHFAVKDTGVGIPVERQEKIFEAFSQADGSMTRKYGGTGLGLTICVRLVEMMGGRVWLESQPGHGSTFHFTVQLAVQNTASTRPIPLQPEQLRDQHALIVDDNFTNRRVLHGMLSRWGMRPTSVEGGREALQALEIAKSTGHPFPLILLDGQMPGMDGFALAEQIQNDPGLLAVTIMMLTSAGHLGDAARCRELGISAYLVKPIRQTELLDGICQVLNKVSTPKNMPLVTRHTLQEDKHRCRVLLAEDNAVNRTLAVRLLEKRGYSVIVAGNGREAVEAFENNQFDVVLMDIQMPEMDGFEATATIRAKEKLTGGHVPIIAMTAHALKSDQERCISAGMDGYVSKPIRTSELFSTIERMVSNEELGSANEAARVPDPIVGRTQ